MVILEVGIKGSCIPEFTEARRTRMGNFPRAQWNRIDLRFVGVKSVLERQQHLLVLDGFHLAGMCLWCRLTLTQKILAACCGGFSQKVV